MHTRLALAVLAALGATAAPVAALTPAEDALAARIPPDVRPYCAPSTTTISGSEAVLFCDLPTTQGLIARYARFPRYAAAEAYYRDLLRRSGGITRVGFGRCSTGTLSGEGVYRRGRIPAGRLACFRRTSGTYLVTLDAGTAIVWWAARPDRDRPRLYAWWTEHGLRGDPEPAVATAGALFPNGLERSLLLDIGADVATSGCVRPRQTGAWLAALRCPLGSRGQVTYRRYADSEAAQRDYLLSIAALGITERAGGACDGGQDTERRYGQGPLGRYACTTVAGRARLEWLDFARDIRGIATSTGGQAALRDWWRTQPR